MDEMEIRAQAERPGLTVPMAWTDETARWEKTGRLDPRDRAEFLERQGLTAPMEWTDERVALDRAERRARLGIPDRPGPLVRQVNAARRVSRALRGILARLVRRANL